MPSANLRRGCHITQRAQQTAPDLCCHSLCFLFLSLIWVVVEERCGSPHPLESVCLSYRQLDWGQLTTSRQHSWMLNNGTDLLGTQENFVSLAWFPNCIVFLRGSFLSRLSEPRSSELVVKLSVHAKGLTDRTAYHAWWRKQGRIYSGLKWTWVRTTDAQWFLFLLH